MAITKVGVSQKQVQLDRRDLFMCQTNLVLGEWTEGKVVNESPQRLTPRLIFGGPPQSTPLPRLHSLVGWCPIIPMGRRDQFLGATELRFDLAPFAAGQGTRGKPSYNFPLGLV